MSDSRALAALRKIVERYGPEVAADSRRVENLLKDHCPDCRREITVLCLALREGVAAELEVVHSGVPLAVAVPRLADKLERASGVSIALCRWAVSAWASVLDIAEVDEAVIVEAEAAVLAELVPISSAETAIVPATTSRREPAVTPPPPLPQRKSSPVPASPTDKRPAYGWTAFIVGGIGLAAVGALALVLVFGSAAWWLMQPTPAPPKKIGTTRVGLQPENLIAPFDADVAHARQIQWGAYLGTPVIETTASGLSLALIPSGQFEMGTSTVEVDAAVRDDAKLKRSLFDDEQPRHTVRISQPFLLGTHEVTQAQFERVMGYNPAHFHAGAGGHDKVAHLDTGALPVESVTWYDAAEFCNELSRRQELPVYYGLTDVRRIDRSISSAVVIENGGNGFRLPTEAEWEYACRAGAASAFHFGEGLNGGEANVDGRLPFGMVEKGTCLYRTASVGSYRANAFGLYDMHGNVCEWCQDWLAPYSNEPDPIGATGAADALEPTERVLRGGSWTDGARHARAARRRGNAPGYQNYLIGFRVARSG